jgi:hypothetical protein
MKNKLMKDDKLKYLHLSELGSKLNLSFSSYEKVAGNIIGLDGIRRKLLILGNNYEIGEINIITLDELSSVSVKKIYHSIKAGELRKRKIHEFMESIFLQFDFNNGRETMSFPFYENEMDNVNDLPDIESKIKKWQIILSKMIGHQNIRLMQKKREPLIGKDDNTAGIVAHYNRL